MEWGEKPSLQGQLARDEERKLCMTPGSGKSQLGVGWGVREPLGQFEAHSRPFLHSIAPGFQNVSEQNAFTKRRKHESDWD